MLNGFFDFEGLVLLTISWVQLDDLWDNGASFGKKRPT